MHRAPFRIIASLTLAAAGIAGATAAPAQNAPRRLLDLDRSDGCELSIVSQGKAMFLRASGLIPGEVYRFALTNGDMQPVVFSGYADGRGGLVQYYLPFRLNRDGGTVRVSIAAARCSLAAQADWDRGVVTIP